MPKNKEIKSRIFAVLLVVFLLTAISPQKTFAHASVVGSDPADNSILDEAPRHYRIWYTEAVAIDFSTFKMLDINGQAVPIEKIERDESDHKQITLTLPDLSPGVYSIHWHVLSEADGHDTQGVLAFGVGSRADVSAASAANAQTAVPWADGSIRWLNFGLLAAIIGAVVIRYLVLSQSESDPEIGLDIQQAQTRILTWATRTVLAAFLLGFIMLAFQVRTLMSTLPENAPILGTTWKLITLLRWGHAWLGRQLLLPVLYILLNSMKTFPTARETKLTGALTGLCAGLLLLVQSFNSHAAAVTPQTTAAVTADFLHLVGVGIWIGGLGALIVGLFPILRRDRPRFYKAARVSYGKFGVLAAFSVAVIILTGLLSTGKQVASVDAWISTLYGRTLLGKIGLMVFMGGIGLMNSMLLHPTVAAPLGRLLRRPDGWTPLPLQRLPRLIALETGVGVLILLGAGILTASPTATGKEFKPFDESTLLGTMTEDIGDMLVSFSAKPNKPGQNVFLIRATSIYRPAPAEILRVIARLTYLDDDIGTISVDAQQIDEGQYHIGGSYFSLSGSWDVEVIVRRSGVEDTVAQFIWVVPPGVDPHPIILSNLPLDPIFTPAAFFGLIVLLSAGLIILRRHRKTAVSPVTSELTGLPVSVTALTANGRQRLDLQAYVFHAKQGEKNERHLI